MSDKNAPEAEVTEAPAWHCMDKAAVIKQLGLGGDHESTGLSSTDAKARLDKYGPNKMTEEKKKTLLERIWDQVANVLVAILVVVALVSMVRAIVEDGTENKISNWIQFGIIFSVIAINTYIGIYQEGNAEKAAEALKSMLSSDARVLRDGKEMMIPGIDVVPGDVVILGLGDKIPCDLRLLKTQNLACQEAALTGESVPIDKVTETIEAPEGLTAAQVPLGDRKNMCYSATLVAQGAGVGMAIATGDYTEIGTINGESGVAFGGDSCDISFINICICIYRHLINFHFHTTYFFYNCSPRFQGREEEDRRPSADRQRVQDSCRLHCHHLHLYLPRRLLPGQTARHRFRSDWSRLCRCHDSRGS